jgi:hypothetical protein
MRHFFELRRLGYRKKSIDFFEALPFEICYEGKRKGKGECRICGLDVTTSTLYSYS